MPATLPTTTATPTAERAAPESRLAVAETVIQRRQGWRLFDWQELKSYRDLFGFLVWRKIRVRYAQSAMGVGWAIIQPVFSAIVFTIVFGRLAKIGSDGVPYAPFVFAALVPWTYFANAVTDGVVSLVGEAGMIRKVYFPRLYMPLSSVAAKLIDFGIAMLCTVFVMVAYQQSPTWNLLLLPMLIGLMVAAAAGFSLWLSTLAIQYRDVKHAVPFFVQMGMYASPVVYPLSRVPDEYRLVYGLNPMVGVIEGFRSALLGTGSMPWDLLAVGATVSAVLVVTGLAYFRRRERLFADVA